MLDRNTICSDFTAATCEGAMVHMEPLQLSGFEAHATYKIGTSCECE